MIVRPITPEALARAATVAGHEIGNDLAGLPSRESPASLLARLGRYQSDADAATRDPAAFVKALFDAVDAAASDAAGEVRDGESYRQSPEAHFGVAGQFRP